MKTTEYTLISDGKVFRIQVKTPGGKDLYRCHNIWTYICDFFTDCDAPVWETGYRWLAQHRLEFLRNAENARVAEKNRIWESVREEAA